MKPLTTSKTAADEALNRAMALHQAGKLDEADRAYNEVLKLDWANGDALRFLGGLYVQRQQNQRARDTLRQALNVMPNHPEIHNNLGVALRNLGMIDEAIEQFELALRARPDYAEAFNNLGHAHFSRGRLTSALVLYLKSIALKPDYLRALINCGVALRELGRGAEALLHLERALALQPKDAEILHEIGFTLQKMKRLEDAVVQFEKALILKPDFFAALNNLGSAYRELNHTDQALAVYERALKLAPHRAEIFVNMGAVFWDFNQLDRAIECFEQALLIDPNHLDALVNFGSVLWVMGKSDAARTKYEAALKIKPDHASAITNLGALVHDTYDLDGALALYEKALRIDSRHPHARFGKGLVQLAYGQYNEGWSNYEGGLGVRMLRGLNRFTTKAWTGAPAPGKRLVIWSEQGLGDSLQFVRYAALCKQRVGKVILLCPKSLRRLFEKCEGVDEVRDTINYNEFDEQIAMMSLPYVFGTTLDMIPKTIPYLFVDPSITSRWRDKLAALTGLKVGLVWAGNARETIANANFIDRRRSLPLDSLQPLLDLPGVSFISLQMKPHMSQIEALGLRDKIVNLMDDVDDFTDTAGIINNLDLVVTVDTSVAHLAGGLGKKVWVLSRYDACWRWLRNRSDSPWYPTARIFGQPSSGDWKSVIKEVRNALKEEAGT